MAKGIKIKLNTGKGQVSYQTQILKGKLDCVIIESFNKIDLIVESSLGYLIVKKNQIVGVDYIAPRVKITSQEFNSKDMLTFDKFNIDEKVIITVMGPKNSAVKIVMRLN